MLKKISPYLYYTLKKKLTHILLGISLVFIGGFGGAHAAIGDIGHWRDSVGGQIPGTAFGVFNFDQEIRNDGIYSKPSNGIIQLNEAGDYLIITTTRNSDPSNRRYNPQIRVSQIAGTGDIFTSYYSGYSRDNSESDAWTRAVGVIIGASANSQIQIEKRRDIDAPTGGSIVNESDVQVIRINQTNYGIYGIGGSGNDYGGTNPNTVEIDSVMSQSDTTAIEANITTDTVTLKGDNKKYLIAWSTSFDTGGTRTQRIGHLEYNGTDILSTRSYCYSRNANNEYCGLGSMDIIETSTADIDIQVEVFRGPGVAADQGGADNNGSLLTDGNGQMVVLELPEYLEAFRSEDSTGGQDITSAQTLNIARDVNISNTLSFTKNSNTLIDVTNSADIFSWGNIWTARGNVSSGARQTTFGSITIDGIEQTIGRHGNYSRGNQGTADTFAMSFHPAGIFTTLTPGVTLGINTDPLPGGELGGNDRTQPGTVGFFALNLDTFIPPELEQSAYRFFENIDSADVGAPLSAQNISAVLSSDSQSFRLRALISITQNQLRENEKDLKLQFAQRVGTCDTAFVGESYIDVTTTTAIAFNNNGTPSDEDILTINVNDPVNGVVPVVNQSYQEINNFTTSVGAIAEDEDGKWDFSLRDNTAPDNTSYCFRMVESDGTLLDSYSMIPEITTFFSKSPGGVDTNLELWLKADAGTSTTTDGAAITSWADQSGNGLDATAVTTPDYRNNDTDSLNYNPVVDFNGINDYMRNLANGVYSDSYFLVIVPDNTIDGTATGGVPFGWDCLSGALSSGTCGLSFAGLVLGQFTAAIPDEVVTHALGSSVNWRSAEGGISSYQAGSPMLISVNENLTNNGTDIYQKGGQVNNTAENTYQTLSSADYGLGRSMDNVNTFYFDGKIAEVINYSSRVSDTERQKIESYLAIKYGITLNSGTQDYIASDGTTTFWDASAAGSYTYNVFGIGRDNIQGLGQIQSKGVNPENILRIEAEGEGSNITNSFVDIVDKEFFMVSNTSGGNTWTAIDAPTSYNILSQQWRVQETGDVGTLSLEFDVGDSDFDVPVLNAGTSYYIVYDSDNDNSLSDETPTALTNTSGNLWEITGLNLSDGQEFTLATEASSNNIPTDISLSSSSIDENSPTGSTVGTLSSTDADLGDTHTYSLVSGIGDNDNNFFSVVGNTLSLNHTADFEIKSTYFIRIATDDGNGGVYQKTFPIIVNNVVEVLSSSLDFENALDDYKYTVTSGNWSRTTNNPFEGSSSMESNNGGVNNSQSCFEINHVHSSTGSVDFYYEVSSQAASDFLRFYLDDVEQQSWSGTVPYAQYTLPNIAPGSHEYKWCYIKDGAGAAGNDNAFIDLITFPTGLTDIVAPTITSTSFASGSLLPGGNHNIVIDYNDTDSGIDTATANITLNKWDGISSWGSDISGTGLSASTITTSSATYPTNNLDFGKYRYNFSINDIAGNTSSTGAIEFYIDEPEFIIGSGSINIGDVNSTGEIFSGNVDITVRTLGAGFTITMQNPTSLIYNTETIGGWNGTTGYGYEAPPFIGNVSAISSGTILGTQTQNINTNGGKNTYTYTIRFGGIVDPQQPAGEYEGNIDFEVNFDY